MRRWTSREPGPIAAAIETPGAFYGLIVDGEHVAPPMLRLALRGLGQAMLVTDAMPPVGGSRTEFRLGGKQIIVRDGRCVTADGILAGPGRHLLNPLPKISGLRAPPRPQSLLLAR